MAILLKQNFSEDLSRKDWACWTNGLPANVFFNLADLLHHNSDLNHLEEPFSNAEIDNVIFHLPSDNFQGSESYDCFMYKFNRKYTKTSLSTLSFCTSMFLHLQVPVNRPTLSRCNWSAQHAKEAVG